MTASRQIVNRLIRPTFLQSSRLNKLSDSSGLSWIDRVKLSVEGGADVAEGIPGHLSVLCHKRATTGETVVYSP